MHTKTGITNGHHKAITIIIALLTSCEKQKKAELPEPV